MDPPPAPVPFRAVRAVLVRPGLWGAALVMVVRLAPRGWWRRWPPSPRPDPAYLGFRLSTQYGEATHSPSPEDLVTFLRWRRAWPGARDTVS